MIPLLSTEGAALEAPVVPRLRRSISPQSYPGLTAGPSHCRPFGPRNFDSAHPCLRRIYVAMYRLSLKSF
jgi:hypothetical protein